MIWTIKYAGMEKAVGDWGIDPKSISSLFSSQAADTLSFRVVAQAGFDAAPTFAFDAIIELWQRPDATFTGGTPWFQGRVNVVPRSATPKNEAQRYEVKGFWFDLEQIVYRQRYATDGLGLPTALVFLNYNTTNGDQIRDALNWAIAAAPTGCAQANLQIGAITVAALLPTSQAECQTVAEIIRNQLQMQPDATVAVDHSTVPPTLNIRRRGDPALGVVTVTMPGDWDEGEITERDDIAVPVVALQYRQFVQIGAHARWNLVPDKYPPQATGLERTGVAATFDLQGRRKIIQEATLDTQPISPTSAAWWLQRMSLREYNAATKQGSVLAGSFKIMNPETPFKVMDQNGELTELLDFELIGGTFANWMRTDLGLDAKRVRLTTRVEYTAVDNNGIGRTTKEVEVAVNLVTTSAPSGVYQTVSSDDPGEAAPVGLAEYLYRSYADKQYQGSVTVTKEQCDGLARPGMLLNVVSATGRFAGMRAIIQEVRENLWNGRTEITFGPPAHLGPAQIVQWLRGIRYRKVYENPEFAMTGKAAKADIELGDLTAMSGAAEVAEVHVESVMKDATGTGKTTVNGKGIKGTSNAGGGGGSSFSAAPGGAGNAGFDLSNGKLVLTAANGAQVVIDAALLPAGTVVRLNTRQVCVGDVPKTEILLDWLEG